jgi:zinc D-Ala-D-Ala carboxypeptidase
VSDPQREGWILDPPREDGRPGEYFTWAELTRTGTGLKNVPTALHRNNLRLVCKYLLDPLRRSLGAIRVTSGFRSIAVNKKVGGARNSFHMRGLAADIKSYNGDFTVWEIAQQVDKLNLPFDQCIVYEGGWVHLGLTTGSPRKQFLWKDEGGYEPLSLERIWGIDRL